MPNLSQADIQRVVNKIAEAGLTSRPRSGALKDLPASTTLAASTLASVSETYVQDIIRLTGGWVH